LRIEFVVDELKLLFRSEEKGKPFSFLVYNFEIKLR